MLTLIKTLEGKVILNVNAHLKSKSEFAAQRKIQSKEILDFIQKEYKNYDYVLWTMDANAGLEEDAIKDILEFKKDNHFNFISALNIFNKDLDTYVRNTTIKTQINYQGENKGKKTSEERLSDYILISNNFGVEKSYQSNLYLENGGGSDHAYLVAELGFNKLTEDECIHKGYSNKK